jgi:DNA-binding CsgD family transcriptional regulator
MPLSRYELINTNTSIERDIFSSEKVNNQENKSDLQLYLLHAVIESFVDGILILTNEGEIVHINEEGREICHHLNGRLAERYAGSVAQKTNLVPREVWSLCESLIESWELFPGENIQLESEIYIPQGLYVRVRVRWMQLGVAKQNLLLVTLEDRQYTVESQIMADIKKYRLTQREAEVWSLRRANLSYKEIATKLYITINTVKKHLKNVYAKQQELIYS